MNTDEKFFGEGKEGELVESSVAEEVPTGEESVAPDRTILKDLHELVNLTFGTRWSQDESSPRRPSDRRPPRHNFPREGSGNFDGRERGDFRGRSNPEGYRSPSRERHFSPSRFGEYRERRPFIPPFDVQFYQEDKSFNLLIEEMQKTCKTYELFTVAKLILQKPERFVVTVRRKPNGEGVIGPLYLSLLDNWVFESEHEAMAYIMQHHIDEFFDVTEEAIEPPKGIFTCVHRCGVTKKLLSAPNYHKYRTILRDHFNGEIRSMPFERFLEKIETTKEESDIRDWLQGMSRKVTHRPKAMDDSVTDLAPLDSLEGAKNYLLKYFKDRILREVTTSHISGISSESMPSRSIGRAIQFFLQRQRHFPFDTANNLRNRFRRAGFGIYRKGKGGISYVCAAKRKFRTDEDVFESNIQALISFLEPLEKVTLESIKVDFIEAHHLPEKETFDSLNWLIREGYVVEYENGTLFLNPKLSSTKGEDKAKGVEENVVIQLDMMETAIEKLSDGTLTVAAETALAIHDDAPAKEGDGIQGKTNQFREGSQ
ncbi:MAG: hypothetical protein LBI77_01005 [Puniceicoccales bacterium]|jgi:hypothetical protein|nr:hypothetical protein [Puniceicoccales bacterium]